MGIQSNLTIFGSPRLSWPLSSAEIKYMLYSLCFWKFLMLANSRVCCGGFVGSPRDFFGFWFLPPFDQPRHLKSGVPLPPPRRVLSYKLLRLEMFKNYCSFTALHTSFQSIIVGTVERVKTLLSSFRAVLICKLIHFYCHKN